MNILVSDLDGTLLNEDGSLPKNINELIKKLEEKDYVFSIATARSPQNVFNLFKHLRINYTAFCSDGAITIKISKNEFSVISEDELSDKSIVNLQSLFSDILNQTKLYFTTSLNDFRIYIENSGNIPLEVFDEIFPYRKWEVVPKFSIDSNDIKFRAFSLFTNDEVEFDEVINTKFQYIKYLETRFFNSSYYWHDFLPIETSKGNALKKELRKFNNIIALGNGANDIELFKEANESFCPSNSNTNLKAISSNIINRECGESFINQVIKSI